MCWDRCQIFRDFSQDACRHLTVESDPEIAQHFRWRNDDESVECAGMSQAIEQVCDPGGKPLFRQPMPIGLLNCAARDAIPSQKSSGLVGTLVPRRWILLLELLFGDEIDMQCSACVSQQPCFRSIGNQHQGVCRDAYVCHDMNGGCSKEG